MIIRSLLTLSVYKRGWLGQHKRATPAYLIQPQPTSGNVGWENKNAD